MMCRADVHIAPRTVRFFRSLDLDVMRLSSSRVERVNAVRQEVLPGSEKDRQDGRVRVRRLPAQ
jgi:hypothetical protein